MPAQTQTHALEFTATEVRKRFVSWEHGEAEREWACLTVLSAHAPGVAPRPLRRETEDGAPVVVMERLGGTPLGGAPLTRPQLSSLAQTLRRIYEVPRDAVVTAGIEERRYGPSMLPGILPVWLGDSSALDECQDARLVRRGVEAALGWLAGPDPVPAPRLVVLGIADLNPANVLWDGEQCRLVDFEDAGLTDPAYELADHVEHLGGRLTATYDAEALADAVGLTSTERQRMECFRRLWAAFWLAMLLPGNGGFHRNPAGTTEAQARHLLALLGHAVP